MSEREFMPSTTDIEKFPERATGPDLRGGESRLAGVSGPAGILERVPDDLRVYCRTRSSTSCWPERKTEEEIVGPGGLLSQLTKRLVERAMEVELTDHLGYEPHQEPPGGAGNTRNGSTPKTLGTEHGPVEIRTPRDRDGSFEPKIVRKRQRRFEGFDEKILALYARGSRRGTSRLTCASSMA